jgi:HD-GYP domain-containing protein (c-di-GMP phosphodiesterase class II)
MIKDFHCSIQDINTLTRVKKIIAHFGHTSPLVIHDDISNVDPSIKHCVFIIDNNPDFFISNYTDTEKKNVIIILNDTVEDLEDFPIEAYITKKRLIVSLGSLLSDLKYIVDEQSDYYPVDIYRLKLTDDCPCDLYLKLGPKKFLKCVKKGNEFDKELQEKYKVKADDLWVIKDDFYQYGDFLFGKDDLERKILDPFSLKNGDDLELIHDIARSCGITCKTINIMEKQVNGIKETANNELKVLLTQFEKLKGSFLYSHSYFTSLIAIQVAVKQPWFRHQHLSKLVLSSMLHDLGFKKAENALYETLTKSKINKLPEDIKHDVLGHVDSVYDMIKTCKDIDSDILNIIYRHHGARGDESYPIKSFGTEIDLLSGIFLLSHAFTLTFFTVEFNLRKLDDVFIYLEYHYNRGNLKKIYPKFKEDVLNFMQQKT